MYSSLNKAGLHFIACKPLKGEDCEPVTFVAQSCKTDGFGGAKRVKKANNFTVRRSAHPRLFADEIFLSVNYLKRPNRNGHVTYRAISTTGVIYKYRNETRVRPAFNFETKLSDRAEGHTRRPRSLEFQCFLNFWNLESSKLQRESEGNVNVPTAVSGGDRRRRPPTASRLKGPRKQKSFVYKLLKRGLAKSFAYKLLKRGLANLMSPTSTSGVAPPLYIVILSRAMAVSDEDDDLSGLGLCPTIVIQLEPVLTAPRTCDPPRLEHWFRP
ncbi:hypothetical protein EVAR_61909_1 [Eumeta japonica]|uniref:Uncharacterized protein n=1 Tax=Eumeta variegata TaxID=151549 RepID=A0A4C1YNL3_EUMVA|nr:hypothetical protein EVAR_61909_1 [Eumeta japonica]